MIIHGRIREATENGLKPVKNAEVKIVGIWKTLDTIIKKTALPPNIIFIYPPLYADCPAKTRCDVGFLASVNGSDKILLSPAEAATEKIRLSNSKYLKPKDLLKVDAEDPYREELIPVKKIDGGISPDQPAWITLSRPLMFLHREGKIVRKSDPTWRNSPVQLVSDGYRGTCCLFLSGLERFPLEGYLKIASLSKASDVEVHRFHLFEATSDENGFYELPPLQRVAQIQLRAAHGGEQKEVKWQPDYTLGRNQIDFQLEILRTSHPI